MSSPASDRSRSPLYVDLDGTLIATDTLWESICLLIRQQPLRALALPIWALGGKAALKTRIAEHVCPDASLLPYRPEIVDRLRAERAAGRTIVLATAAHERIARAVAEELDLFDRVLATSAERNLKGKAKLEAIREDAGGAPFAYVGDSQADLPIWAAAESALVVSASPSRSTDLAKRVRNPELLQTTTRPTGRFPALRALRPHQWAKNALIGAPLVLSHQALDLHRLVAVAVGFAAFCLVASAGYLVNDLLDIEADRRHSSKRTRPFAAGRLSIPHGLLMIALLLVAGGVLSVCFVSGAFTAMVAVYLAATLSYSLYLKERLFLDVLVLAGLYTHRVLAGGVAAGVEVSSWLLAFSVFFFLSLALVKRYVELLENYRPGVATISRRAYQVDDTGLVETMGISSGYLSVLVLGLYVSHDDVSSHYTNPELLWLVTPLMLYWISRVWLLARRGELAADPVVFAATDRVSYGIVVAIFAIGLGAALTGD